MFCDIVVNFCCVLKWIFVFGGKNGFFVILSSVEYYEFERDRWVEVLSMNFRRFEFGVVVLDGK